MRTVARRLGFGLLIAAVLFAAAVIVTARRGDSGLWPPRPGAPTTEVFVVSHGYHAGIIVPRRALAEEASRRGLIALGNVATRFAAFDRLEIGWGDEALLPRGADGGVIERRAGRPRAVSAGQSVRAARRRRQRRSARRVQPLRHGAHRARRGELRPPRGQARRHLRPATRAGRPEDLGPGLYGPSLFFRANGTFHLFNVCNHWLAGLLDAAGVPTAPVLATLPFGLLIDLEWRSGVARLPPPEYGKAAPYIAGMFSCPTSSSRSPAGTTTAPAR